MDNIEKIINDDITARIYEVSYLLLPTLTDSEVILSVNSIKSTISLEKGTLIFEENPRKIELAYTMVKNINNKNERFDQAFFGWIKFEADASKIANIEENLKKNDKIIRFMLIKTTKENTFLTKGFVNKSQGDKFNSGLESQGQESLPMDKEAVDREIEAMVTDIPA